MDWIDCSDEPGIEVDSNSIYFIHEPEGFYTTLLVGSI